jgi:hypothetical protein
MVLSITLMIIIPIDRDGTILLYPEIQG